MTKYSLFENWHLMRWIRLSFGIIIAVQAIQTHDVLVGAISILFIFQAVTNTACCGAHQCNMYTDTSSSLQREKEEEQELNIKEIKTK